MSNSKDKCIDQTPTNKEGLIQVTGNHECAVSGKCESDLESYLGECNKSHADLIPIKDLGERHLPENHRNKGVLEFIQSVADITVKLKVKGPSPHRPFFWPHTSREYPFTPSSVKPVSGWCGSGRISLISRYHLGYDDDGFRHIMSLTVCRCRKCRTSNAPSTVWWDVEVLTATHVVYDDIEAGRTTCRLFYDDKDSPVVTLDGVGVGFRSVERDWCRLICMTCDTELGERLQAMKKRCNTVWKGVHKEYFESEKEEHKLMFIVSHPHGCVKKVSIGHWHKKVQSSQALTNCVQFCYKTSTCPGSSGATVYCLGYTGWWLYQLIHSGSTDDGENFCSPGFIL